MHGFRISSLGRSRYLLAGVAGLLLAAAFPRMGVAGFAWVAPGLMVAAALGKSGGESFRIGYVGGLAYHLAALYWLLLIPYRWHGIPWGPALGWLALSAYLAFYPAVWVWFVVKIQRPAPKSPAASSPLTLVSAPAVAVTSWPRRLLWTLSGGAAWVALEMLQGWLFTGFPWNPLGASQWQMVPLIQIASVTGVSGVSFMAVWTSLSLLSGGLMAIQRPNGRSVWIGEMFLPILTVAAVFHFGMRQLQNVPTPARTLRVTCVQPSIPQTLIWDTGQDAERFAELMQLSEQALTNATDLLVWPEAAVPSYARWDTNICPVITNFARSHRVWLVLGSDDIGWPAEPRHANDYEYYNASFLVSPDGEFVAGYKKRNLVIFGEYVPLTRWLPFLQWFTPIQGGFTPGDRPARFSLESVPARVSVLICFEDAFGWLGRESAGEDVDFLVNLTNDGWFGESAAAWQQAAAAAFRAVENGIPLLRCSNTGITCWMDCRGRVRDVFHDGHGSVYGPGFMTAEMPLLTPGESREPTFYHKHGSWFGWTCCGVALGMLLARLNWRSRRFGRQGS